MWRVVYQEQLLALIDSLGADVAFGIQDVAEEASSTVFVSALRLASDIDANIERYVQCALHSVGVVCLRST